MKMIATAKTAKKIETRKRLYQVKQQKREKGVDDVSSIVELGKR